MGKQTYGLAAVVSFFWLPPLRLRLSLKPASSPTSGPHQSPAMQTGRVGLPLDRIFWKEYFWKNRMLFASRVAQGIAVRPTGQTWTRKLPQTPPPPPMVNSCWMDGERGAGTLFLPKRLLLGTCK